MPPSSRAGIVRLTALAQAYPLLPPKLHRDHLDDRILNTEDELTGGPVHCDRCLDRFFEYDLIVSGWSATSNPALRSHRTGTEPTVCDVVGILRRGPPRLQSTASTVRLRPCAFAE